MTKKIAIIFASLIILLAIGVGIYLSLGKRSPVSPQTSAKKLTEIKVANWKTYQNKDFSFQYPADWLVNTQKISTDQFQQEITSLSSSASAVITIRHQPTTSGAKIPDLNLFTQQKFASGSASSSAQSQSMVISGKKLTTYSLKDPISPLVNYLTVPYLNLTGDYYEISFNYIRSRSDWDYPKLFDKIISTIKFK